MKDVSSSFVVDDEATVSADPGKRALDPPIAVTEPEAASHRVPDHRATFETSAKDRTSRQRFHQLELEYKPEMHKLGGIRPSKMAYGNRNGEQREGGLNFRSRPHLAAGRHIALSL
ncbi:MAG TPA: hypothetical protein VMA37_18475 [Acetobacteraceae bacterium]|nr:hypothetical protein [Acetobacteraceae bacterium]